MPLDFALSEEQEQIKAATRDMLARFAPRREEWKEQILKGKKLPQELWDAYAELGLLGALLPEEYGGTGAGLLALAIAFEEMASEGMASGLLLLTAMDSACILRNGSDELKRRVLPEVAKGRLKLCFALTEPDAGSNTFRLSTLARREGDAYRVSGQKVFITGADIADRMLLVARTMTIEECERQQLPKMHGLSLFLVDPKAKGVTLSALPTRGIEAMRQFQIFLDDVAVGPEDLLGVEGQGAFALFNSLNPERILAAATACGMADRCIRLACAYARERKVFKGRPIGAYQAIQHPLAEARIELEAARLAMWRAAWAFDKDLGPLETGHYSNVAKFLAAELAIKAADRAIETLGGYGFSEEYEVIHYWEAARLLRTAPITKEMILNYVAEHVLELPRSY